MSQPSLSWQVLLTVLAQYGILILYHNRVCLLLSAPPWLVSSLPCKHVHTLKSQCAHYAQACFFLNDTALVPLTFPDPSASFCSIFVLIRFSQHISLFHFLHLERHTILLNSMITNWVKRALCKRGFWFKYGLLVILPLALVRKRPEKRSLHLQLCFYDVGQSLLVIFSFSFGFLSASVWTPS